MSEKEDYQRWFERATGNVPYRYQGNLALASIPPSVLAVPTGSGKTKAIFGAWMYQRLKQGTGPRRLVYALPMRTLVEQTCEVAEKMRDALGLDTTELPIHVLMGGEETREGDWRLRPEADQIIIGTIDMLLSRALNRGYGESRFAWPVSFGLLNADCRWIFDEVQLMGPSRATSAQLDGLRTAFGTVLSCETMWVSATVDRTALETVDRPLLGETMSLPESDESGPLRDSLTASKVLRRIDLAGHESKDVPRQIARLAIDSHRTGTRTLVVLNRVESAQRVFTELAEPARGDDAPTTVLLHSRFRPPDREAHMDATLAEPGEAGVIVVSTQVIEAGVDLSSRTLLTETAPFSSIVQRLGRCNRTGRLERADVIWLDHGEPGDGAAGHKAAAPYLPEDLRKARATLLGLEGVSLSPQALGPVAEEVEETADDPVVLRRRDLIELFDTGPDLSGTDVDISPFIREDDERTVLACFREIGEDEMPIEQGLPDRREVIQIPLASIANRPCWKADYLDRHRRWERRRGTELLPGSTVILDASEGGYTSELGWDGRSREAVEIIDAPKSPGPETVEDEMKGNTERELLDHLDDVKAQAERLLAQLDLGPWNEPVVAAAALHDVGKAHPAFQAMLRGASDLDPDANEVGKLWAKGGRTDGERKRRFLRHELAGALVLRKLAGALSLPHPDLTTYLVAAHHGKVRLSIRPAPGERQPEATAGARFALGVIDGDLLPAVETPLGTLPPTTLSLECMELGADDSWTNATLALRDAPELGPFRLALLEAVVRIADWRASA